MSSVAWMQQIEQAFLDWHVEDYSGNNFALYKEVFDAAGRPVVVWVGEISTITCKHPVLDRPLTLKEYDLIRKDEVERDKLNAHYQTIYLRDEKTAEVDYYGDSASIQFDSDTLAMLKATMERYYSVYFNLDR